MGQAEKIVQPCRRSCTRRAFPQHPRSTRPLCLSVSPTAPSPTFGGQISPSSTHQQEPTPQTTRLGSLCRPSLVVAAVRAPHPFVLGPCQACQRLRRTLTLQLTLSCCTLMYLPIPTQPQPRRRVFIARRVVACSRLRAASCPSSCPQRISHRWPPGLLPGRAPCPASTPPPCPTTSTPTSALASRLLPPHSTFISPLLAPKAMHSTLPFPIQTRRRRVSPAHRAPSSRLAAALPPSRPVRARSLCCCRRTALFR